MKKIIIVTGPQGCGKTTRINEIVGNAKATRYNSTSRFKKTIKKYEPDTQFLIFDELDFNNRANVRFINKLSEQSGRFPQIIVAVQLQPGKYLPVSFQNTNHFQIITINHK